MSSVDMERNASGDDVPSFLLLLLLLLLHLFYFFSYLVVDDP